MTDRQTDRQTDRFTVFHTSIAKGIAILLMVYHHLFVIPERLNNNYISCINLLGCDFQSIIANFAKICVCIFVFCSGVGLYYSLIKLNTLRSMYKKVLLHGLKFLTNFWVILLFVFPIGCLLQFFNFDIYTLIRLVSASYIAEYWFVKQYIVLIMLAPVFVRLFQNKKLMEKILPILFVITLYAVLKIIINTYYQEENEFIRLLNIWIRFFVGMVCAHFNVIIFYLRIKGFKKWLVYLSSILISVLLRVLFSNNPTSMKADFIVVPLFILPLVTIFHDTRIGNTLAYFGKHSTNIWLTHTFWCYYFGQSIVLLPKYSILIYIWLIILSLLSSYVINLLYVPICNLLFSKDHKLSYKGYLYFNRRS